MSVLVICCTCFFFFSSRRRHTRFDCDWSSDVCSSDLAGAAPPGTPSIYTGVGVPQPPGPQPDVGFGGRRTINAADLYNPQIKAQMDNLDAQIADRFNSLGTASTQRTRGTPSQRESLLSELNYLQHAKSVH